MARFFVTLFALISSTLAFPILIPRVPLSRAVSPYPSQNLYFVPIGVYHPDSGATSVRAISLDTNRNHALTVEQQNEILNFGETLSLDITNGILSPLTALNNRISSAASQLPSYLAANGAVIGSAIATPIHFGTLAANNIASGLTGTLVSIPVAFATGTTAQVVGMVKSGQQLYDEKYHDLQQFVSHHAHHILPPLAAIKGAHAIVHGAAMKTLGSAAHQIGNGLHGLSQTFSNVATTAQKFAQDATSYAEEPEVIEQVHESEAKNAINEDEQVTYDVLTTPAPLPATETPFIVEDHSPVSVETEASLDAEDVHAQQSDFLEAASEPQEVLSTPAPEVLSVFPSQPSI